MSTYTQRLMNASYDEARDMIEGFNNDEIMQAFESMIRLEVQQPKERTMTNTQHHHFHEVKHRLAAECVERMY